MYLTSYFSVSFFGLFQVTRRSLVTLFCSWKCRIERRPRKLLSWKNTHFWHNLANPLEEQQQHITCSYYAQKNYHTCWLLLGRIVIKTLLEVPCNAHHWEAELLCCPHQLWSRLCYHHLFMQYLQLITQWSKIALHYILNFQSKFYFGLNHLHATAELYSVLGGCGPPNIESISEEEKYVRVYMRFFSFWPP